VGVAELSAGRVAWARNAEAMSRLGNDSDFSISNHWYSPTLKSLFIHRLPGLSSVMFGDVMAVFGDVMAVFVDVMAVFGDVMAVFGDVMAVFGDVDTVMDHATPQIATRRNQRDRRNAADSLWVLKVTRRRILPSTAII